MIRFILNWPFIIKKIDNIIGTKQKISDTVFEIFSALVIFKCIQSERFSMSYPSSPQIGKAENTPVSRLDIAKLPNGRKWVVLYRNTRTADTAKFIIHPPENTASWAGYENLLVFLQMIMP